MQSSPVILITGASGGIGAATAKRCADRGAIVAVHYNSSETKAREVLNTLGKGEHFIVQADIKNPAEVEALVQSVYDRHGRLDVLVNNAGVSKRLDIRNIDYATFTESWRHIVDTNLTAAANLSFCAAKKMLDQGGGRIVNVSSRGAFRGEPLMPWYGASKAGMNAMGQSMAQALGPDNIFVYTVAPGFVETEMARAVLESPEGAAIKAQSPINRVAMPDEIANTVCYLALDAPEWMTGCIVDVNGASYLRS